MRVLRVYSKETFAEIELSMTQIRYILDFLDRSEIKYSSEKEPQLKNAVEYVKNDFFSTLDQLFEQFNKGTH